MKTSDKSCRKPFCFFCIMNEPNPSLRRPLLAEFFMKMPRRSDEEHVLVLSSLWKIAMTQPDDPEFPSVGIFECMANLILKAIKNKSWLLRHQNIYIPYYAAHIIGSYTLKNPEFAEKAVNSGVIPPLMELLRGKISWVEQRVAIRALRHLATHEAAFQHLSVHEKEIVELTINTASTCISIINNNFIKRKNKERLKYQSDLLTRGVGGLEFENRKAEEWTIQIQSSSLSLLERFAQKEKCLNLICKQSFLRILSEILAKKSSTAGFRLIRTLCNSKFGRFGVANSKEAIIRLCNTIRSSDHCRQIAIESLVLILKDPEARCMVLDIAALYLRDLVEDQKVGEAITQILLQDYSKIKYGQMKLKCEKAQRALEEVWDIKVDRRKREKLMSREEVRERKAMASEMKREGNQLFLRREVEAAAMSYSKGLELCPLKNRKERIVLYSNRAQCYLLLKETEATIRDATRALCLSSEGHPHGKSLWRRAQAYDLRGMARESLMDCLLFTDGYRKEDRKMIPSYAARLISKQLNATSLFAGDQNQRVNKT
ncbi:hypothetical protein Nepgr_025901 [Nepenthes gracilis]|uniref:Protein unc-45 homolog B n=1 Tax=Nepenthes gracilis TaxID=150966 RepID=A0AAD3Y040_NEPGR|nr:hypothetical protein Nepgr_025901 [Nepenthes gracilis]